MDVITRIVKLRYFRLAAFAVAGVAVAGAAVLVTASAAGLNVGFRGPSSNQHPTAGTAALTQGSGKAAAICNDLIGHFPRDLAVTHPQVDPAFPNAPAP